jgi:hypothetical protein
MSDFNFDDFDLGGMSTEAAFGFDPSMLENVDFSGFEGVDLSGLEGIDLGGFEGMDFDSLGLDGLNLGALEGIDLSGFEGMDFDSLGLEGMDLGGSFSVGDFDQAAPPSNIAELMNSMGSAAQGNLADINFESLHTEGMTPEQLTKRQELMDLGGQNFGSSVDMDKSMGDFNKNLKDIMENRGGFTSQWQQSGSDRIMINDDGSGIGINENGEAYALSKPEVDQMVRNKQLNTYESGYNTATGGNRTAPGGGLSLGGGKYLTTDGKVIYTDKNGNLTTTSPDKTTTDTKKPFNLGGGGGGGGKDDNSLLMLLMLMMMMNQNKGGGSSAVIPGLTATQKQTPYTQQQKSAGYRPGQGGVTYFEPTQYSPNMAAGGGISRLLRGPGDGVSDSIPAVISNGMAKGGQPAKLARGEYVIDARTVAALGNGSTDAGAERLDKMRKNILRDDRRAGVGKDSKAYRHLLA